MLNPDTRGFQCINCHKWVSINKLMGTKNRNHCPYCLWSVHVDMDTTGDRLSSCESGMKPTALTFKSVGQDRCGKPQKGELMIVHGCVRCGKISINRIASDDKPEELLKIYEDSLNINGKEKAKLKDLGINIIGEKGREEIKSQLFGK